MNFSAIVLLFIALPAAAGPTQHTIVCPPGVAKSTLKITTAPAGWTPFVPFEYKPDLPLHSAGIMWGAPSTMLMAKPPFSGKIHGKYTERWPDLATDPSEKWMACVYGKDRYDDAILSQRLPDAVTECMVTYGKKAGDVDIACTW